MATPADNAALMRAFAVPTVMFGNAPEPRSMMERGAALIACAEPFCISPFDLGNEDAEYVATYRRRRFLGF